MSGGNKELNHKQKYRPNNKRTEVPPNHLLHDIKKTKEQIDGTLTLRKYREHGRHSHYLIKKHFDTWNNAKRSAGLTNIKPQKGNPKHTTEDLVKDLKNTADQLGVDQLTYNQYKQHGNAAATTIEKRFGSWTQAKKEAGLLNQTQSETEKRENIIQDIKNTQDNVFGDITKDEYLEHGNYTEHDIRSVFGGWTNAKTNATQKT